MSIFFTADTHFGHKNVIQHCNRPFKDVEDMNNTFVKNWNSVITDDDTVYHLGDLSFYNMTKTVEILESLNGNIILIRSNHDKDRFARSLVSKGLILSCDD